jgi:cytochrome c oxidase assembly protein subunit 15
MWVEVTSEVLHSPMVEGDEYLGGIGSNQQRMGIQWLHRLGAIAVLFMFIYLAIKQSTQRRAVAICFSLLAIQIVLGILNAVLLLPLSLALLHNTFAMLLWMSAINGMTIPEIEEETDEIAQELLA